MAGEVFIFGAGGSGGGGGLNFRVIGGTSAPSNPKENDIWVNTDVEITSWFFSATEPERPADALNGPVWIYTGNSSAVEFNVLKKNGIQVYPVVAKQYVDGAWVDKSAETYKSGVWTTWWDGGIYDAGDEYLTMTGGWIGEAVAYSTGFSSAGDPIIERKADNIVVRSSGQNLGGILRTANKVEIMGRTKLTADIFASKNSYCSICFWTDIGKYRTDNLAQEIQITNTTRDTIETALTLPDGKYYVGLAVLDGRSITMHSMKLS